MESVVRLTPLSWIAPRIAVIAMSLVYLYILGWLGPRMVRPGRYSTAVRLGYALGVVGFAAVGLLAAWTL